MGLEWERNRGRDVSWSVRISPLLSITIYKSIIGNEWVIHSTHRWMALKSTDEEGAKAEAVQIELDYLEGCYFPLKQAMADIGA